MATFGHLAAAAPDVAALVADRLGAAPAYLATTRDDGSPRVHPVTPILGADRLWVFMEPTSPKGRDLRTRPRYALHAGVADSQGTGGEAWVAGSATPVDDPADRAAAVAAASYEPAERYVLFELHVDEAGTTTYDGGAPTRRRWRAGAP